MDKDIYISKDMIKAGLNKGVIRITNFADEGYLLVCRIGEYYFFFAGMEMESYSVENYMKITTEEDRINSIFEILDDFRIQSLFQVEYSYYYYYLKEHGI